ncbi:MAG: glycosyltransferase [Methylocystis sp.]|nr:glycosyltransferase [Methylocystis sp.]
MNASSNASVAANASRIKESATPARRGVDALASRQKIGAVETSPRALPVEIAFLQFYGVPVEALRYAATLAARQGVCADEALLAEGFATEDVYYRALADHLGVAFFGETPELSPASVATADSGYARLRHETGGLKWVFAPRGVGVFRLMSAARTTHGRPLFAVTTRARFIEAARRADSSGLARAAAYFAERADPELCVRNWLRRGPLGGVIVAFMLMLGLLFSPSTALMLLAALPLAGAFLASIFLRLAACAASFEAFGESPSIDDQRLPVYTVVVALYKEAAVAGQLARALDALDYPRAKLDIKFVVECDDDETAEALRAHPPRAPHEIVVAPEGAPRTKPRALNVAMPLARGALVCVFDAEDLPEPRQLRRAAGLFARLPPEIACLQASLVIDNSRLNWKTALFAIEYAALFDVFNRGLSRLGLPLFLGGTSNHFRIAPLREIGFWDAFNVTEDADLGLRLARAGYAVRTFASETYEEAPARFGALVKQRSRWFKGWMQTAYVHCRRPMHLFVDLGPRRALAVIAMFTGGFLGPLVGPLLSARLAYDAAYGDLLRPKTSIEFAFSVLWMLVAISGAFALLAPMLIGMARRRLSPSWPALLFLPLWLLMLSLAAWRALIDLWRRPFHWEKTEHGLTQRGDVDGGRHGRTQA